MLHPTTVIFRHTDHHGYDSGIHEAVGQEVPRSSMGDVKFENQEIQTLSLNK